MIYTKVQMIYTKVQIFEPRYKYLNLGTNI